MAAVSAVVLLMGCGAVGRHCPVGHPSAVSGLQRGRVCSVLTSSPTTRDTRKDENDVINTEPRSRIVLISGFEAFNTALYRQCAADVESLFPDVAVSVFSDRDIVSRRDEVDAALATADAFVGSLLFDYDDVEYLLPKVEAISGPRLIFECATELMSANRVGSFQMAGDGEGPAGPPPAVKAILSKFGSGKEEDKLAGYLKLLSVGPQLLRFVPGDKASDLRSWLEAYRYWNQGGRDNVVAMLQLLAQRYLEPDGDGGAAPLPAVVETPALGLVHPLARGRFFATPAEFVKWRTSAECRRAAEAAGFQLAPPSAPRVAVLLFRKHVITAQPYIPQLLTILEREGLFPVPIFINGVEAHTVVRDLLTTDVEDAAVRAGARARDSSFRASAAVRVDAIVNTIGFPLVGGPAGSMEAGRNVAVAKDLLSAKDVPYVVAAPLLLQDLASWRRSGVQGLQSVVLYALPELDGAVDTVVLGGLAGDRIGLVPERVRKLTRRVHSWVRLRRTPKGERNLAVLAYGFPPNVGAVGTAALLNVPASLDSLLRRLHNEGYDVGNYANDPDASGEALVAALALLSRPDVIGMGPERMEAAVDAAAARARAGDRTVSAALGAPGAGLGGAVVRAVGVTGADLHRALGPVHAARLQRQWGDLLTGAGGSSGAPGVAYDGSFVVAGLQVGRVFLGVQPLLGIEGDPMRLLFDRDLTPHPQYAAFYRWISSEDGLDAHALLHFGMHGTVEWLPGQSLGSDAWSWPDVLLEDVPNFYVYAANNPSESTLAKRRGYATLISHNVPPYARAGLYLELANLKDLIDEYGGVGGGGASADELREPIVDVASRAGLLSDVPLPESTSADAIADASPEVFRMWLGQLQSYLAEVQDRLFSSGLHALGGRLAEGDLASYLAAFFGERLSPGVVESVARLPRGAPLWELTGLPEAEAAAVDWARTQEDKSPLAAAARWLREALHGPQAPSGDAPAHADSLALLREAVAIKDLLLQSTDEEMDAIVRGLDGGYVAAAPGGDLLRDGAGVLPTGRNIHALDPYRMPSAGAWARGQNAAKKILDQHRAANNGAYPETVAVMMWGLDAIKTRGESVAIALALVGAEPVKEGTGRVVRFDLVPLERLGRPRIDVLASLSGIFRDSFANLVDLLDDLFERAAAVDEPVDANFIRKHALELRAEGAERPSARLFSNPPGDFGSMVNERVGSGEWDGAEELADTWASRNVFSYGRGERGEDCDGAPGQARPEVLNKLLATTERVVQEIDSVEYGLTDIQVRSGLRP